MPLAGASRWEEGAACLWAEACQSAARSEKRRRPWFRQRPLLSCPRGSESERYLSRHSPRERGRQVLRGGFSGHSPFAHFIAMASPKSLTWTSAEHSRAIAQARKPPRAPEGDGRTRRRAAPILTRLESGTHSEGITLLSQSVSSTSRLRRSWFLPAPVALSAMRETCRRHPKPKDKQSAAAVAEFAIYDCW